MQTAVGHEKRTPPPIPGRGTRAYDEIDSRGLEEETADETISISAITDEESLSEKGDVSSVEQDSDSRLPPEQSLAPPIPDTSLAPPVSQPVSVPPMPAVTPALTTKDSAESAQAPIQENAVSGSQTASPAEEAKYRGTSSPAAVKPSAPGSDRAGSAFGPALVGAVVGGALAIFIMKGIAPSTEMSPAQRVVVTKQEAELSLEQKEVLKTAERWLSYLALTAATEPQLRSRIDESQETTSRAKALGSALMMTAHLVDLKRVTQAPERQKLISLYERRYAQHSQGFSRYAEPGLKKVGAPVDSRPQPKATVAQSGPKTGKPNSVDEGVSKLEGNRGTSPVVVEAKSAKDTPAISKGTSPTAQKQKVASGVSYKRMLKVGTRHLENGRLSDADTALKKAAELKPKAHAPQAKLGYVALNRGKLQQALKYFKRALDIKPRDRETLLGLGSVYEKMGRKSDAKAIYLRYQSYFNGANDRRRIEYKLEKLGQ